MHDSCHTQLHKVRKIASPVNFILLYVLTVRHELVTTVCFSTLYSTVHTVILSSFMRKVRTYSTVMDYGTRKSSWYCRRVRP